VLMLLVLMVAPALAQTPIPTVGAKPVPEWVALPLKVDPQLCSRWSVLVANLSAATEVLSWSRCAGRGRLAVRLQLAHLIGRLAGNYADVAATRIAMTKAATNAT
jgi:hypothetical protein